MTLDETIAARYPHETESCKAIKAAVLAACRHFIDNKLGDNDTVEKLQDASDAKYWQQLSEILLAHQLMKKGIELLHPPAGPDFLIEVDGKKIWIEVMCPEPNGLPEKWQRPDPGTQVITYPFTEILLRWTTAVKEKSEKLMGNAKDQGYLKKGIVGAGDIYVIAINGRLLRRGDGGPELVGISRFPYAVEAVFPVGAHEIHIDHETMKVVGRGHQNRTQIPKPNGAAVPATIFLNPAYAAISAIWAVDVDENILLDEPRPTALIYNPLATNPLPRGLLPAFSEYVAIDQGDTYQLERHDTK